MSRISKTRESDITLFESYIKKRSSRGETFNPLENLKSSQMICNFWSRVQDFQKRSILYKKNWSVAVAQQYIDWRENKVISKDPPLPSLENLFLEKKPS
jgi:hypothetical protein